ncbi:MAG: 50S ribosomal protein L13 [Thiotrichales bacterium]|nr:MAG: 50S ribosomal protein L13 [Thiotrichales bacterium]
MSISNSIKVKGYRTYTATAQDTNHAWYLVDATDKTLGRLASQIAIRLRGKHKPEYTPHVDTGDYVVVINAEKIRVTGKKAKDKTYYNHTGFPGGLKEITFEKLIAKFPTAPLEKAVKNMLPRGPLGRQMFTKLKVYAGAEHSHVAQQPELIEL